MSQKEVTVITLVRDWPGAAAVGLAELNLHEREVDLFIIIL
jgi:hypothetical protein